MIAFVPEPLAPLSGSIVRVALTAVRLSKLVNPATPAGPCPRTKSPEKVEAESTKVVSPGYVSDLSQNLTLPGSKYPLPPSVAKYGVGLRNGVVGIEEPVEPHQLFVLEQDQIHWRHLVCISLP